MFGNVHLSPQKGEMRARDACTPHADRDAHVRFFFLRDAHTDLCFAKKRSRSTRSEGTYVLGSGTGAFGEDTVVLGRNSMCDGQFVTVLCNAQYRVYQTTCIRTMSFGVS